MFSRYGRPSYDPSAFLRISILGQYLGLKSDRKTLEMIRENICYRRFVSASFIPHASTLSRMRRRLGEDFFKTVFEHTIHLATQLNILDGEELYTDCTLIEACASDDKRSITFQKKGGRLVRKNRFDKDAGFVTRGSVRPGFYHKAMYTIDSKARVNGLLCIQWKDFRFSAIPR